MEAKTVEKASSWKIGKEPQSSSFCVPPPRLNRVGGGFKTFLYVWYGPCGSIEQSQSHLCAFGAQGFFFRTYSTLKPISQRKIPRDLRLPWNKRPRESRNNLGPWFCECATESSPKGKWKISWCAKMMVVRNKIRGLGVKIEPDHENLACSFFSLRQWRRRTPSLVDSWAYDILFSSRLSKAITEPSP